MVDIQLVSALVFFLALSIFLYIKRSQLKTEGFFPIFYFSMFRTSLGLDKMDSYAKKHSKFFDIISKIGIVVGFLGMIVISVTLVYYLVQSFLKPDMPSGVQVVLPFKVKGTFYVPFFYWISCLAIIAIVHEFSHGVIARLRGIPIKSSGFAFMSIIVPIIPAAFVEPDEEKLKKKKTIDQLSVFAAGPFSNLLLALIAFLIVIFIFGPLNSVVYTPNGVTISSVLSNMSADRAGVLVDERIIEIDNYSINKISDISLSLSNNNPGDVVSFKTNRTEYNLTLGNNPSNESLPYVGVMLLDSYSLRPGLAPYKPLFNAYDWIAGFFFWMFVLNLGVGLFNLAPLGIADGGRMLQLVIFSIFSKKKKRTAEIIWKVVSIFFIVVVVSLVLQGFIFG